MNIFLDDGGVMNDNERRGPEWERLVGRFFAPRLGGDPAAWGAVNPPVARREWQQMSAHFTANPGAPLGPFLRSSHAAWTRDMCRGLGIDPPEDEETLVNLSRECGRYVTRRVRSAYPGAVGAIRRLHAAGHTLRTASGEVTWELDGYLTGMRVRGYFVELFGTDRIDTAKFSHLYYERVLAAAGVTPGEALIVDDSEAALGWAAQVGARTILCRVAPPADGRHGHIRRLAELPAMLERGSLANS